MSRVLPIPPPPIDELTARAAAELAAGRPWEARYLLASRIGREPYNPDFYEVYGRALLAIGEGPGAGLWLFLSGRRKPEYEPSIARFVGRRGRQVYDALPPHVRLRRLEDYPEVLRAELQAFGVPDDPKPPPPAPVPDRATEAWAAVFLALGCGGSLVFAAISLVVGATVVGGWVLDRVFG